MHILILKSRDLSLIFVYSLNRFTAILIQILDMWIIPIQMLFSFKFLLQMLNLLHLFFILFHQRLVILIN
jgi:hypothetical protein